MEADPRHAEFVVEQLGLKDDKGIGTPGLSGADEDDTDEDVLLTGADLTSYRGVIARCNYLASDRPYCNFAIKEGCREMSSPISPEITEDRQIPQEPSQARLEIPDAGPAIGGHREDRRRLGRPPPSQEEYIGGQH